MRPINKKEEAPRTPERNEPDETVEGEEGGGGSYGHPRPEDQSNEDEVPESLELDDDDEA